jgi:hypothetical protein
MYFFKDYRRLVPESARTMGIYGENQEAAILMAQRVWDRLAADEPALGYSLVDTMTRQICYVEVERKDPRPSR